MVMFCLLFNHSWLQSIYYNILILLIGVAVPNKHFKKPIQTIHRTLLGEYDRLIDLKWFLSIANIRNPYNYDGTEV
jgi:hypothetical protein